MEHTIYIGLGSNLGDRRANLTQAIVALASQMNVTEESPVYETEPWGYHDQPDFLNQVVRGSTELSPHATLAFLKETEIRLGRTPAIRFGPRLIDLDLLLYEDLVIDSPALQIPHPGLAERAFVLAPLADLAPELEHPELGKSIEELLLGVDSSGVHPLQEAAGEGRPKEAGG